tara:strand:+ start:32 stop:289 length:258 start_codon:yes stop_codon:yes gene_type:complete
MSNGFTEKSGAEQGDGCHKADADQAASISASPSTFGSAEWTSRTGCSAHAPLLAAGFDRSPHNPTHADFIEPTSTEQSNRMNRGF